MLQAGMGTRPIGRTMLRKHDRAETPPHYDIAEYYALLDEMRDIKHALRAAGYNVTMRARPYAFTLALYKREVLQRYVRYLRGVMITNGVETPKADLTQGEQIVLL